jgi:hypothetical protein
MNPPRSIVAKVLAVDVETTGQTERTGALVEFGAAVWRVGAKTPDATFYAYLGTDGAVWCARTRLEFWDNATHGAGGKTPLELLRERVARDAIAPLSREAAAHRFVAWARAQYAAADERMIVVTDTSGFDHAFLSGLLAEHQETAPCAAGAAKPYSLNYLFGAYAPVRDINSFYLGVGGELRKWGARDRMMRLLGVDELPAWVRAYEHTHNPLDDANSIGAKVSFFLSRGDDAKRQKPAE